MLRVEEVIDGVDEWWEKEYKQRQRRCDMPHNRKIMYLNLEANGEVTTVWENKYQDKQKIIRITADVELCAKCSKKLN